MTQKLWESPMTVLQARTAVNESIEDLYNGAITQKRKWALGNPGIYESPVAINPFGYNTSQVIAMMDETLTSGMVNKKELGIDELGNSIFEYVYDKPIPLYRESVGGAPSEIKPYPHSREKAKILINSGTHGDEKGSPVGLALFLQELVSNSISEELRFIRDNAILKVIPILNPSGFDSDARVNHNSVDLNRDFINLSQVETLTAKSWIDANSDALGVLDVHNTVGAISLWDYIGMIDNHELCINLLNNLEHIWEPRLSLNPPYGSIYAFDAESTMNAYVTSKKMYGTTIEFSRNSDSTNGVFNSNYDALAVQMGKELLVNLIINLIKRNS